jgi:hypothetical protein
MYCCRSEKKQTKEVAQAVPVVGDDKKIDNTNPTYLNNFWNSLNLNKFQGVDQQVKPQESTEAKKNSEEETVEDPKHVVIVKTSGCTCF